MVGLYGKCMFNILRNGQLFCKVVVAVYELSDYSKSESICGQSIKNNFIVHVRGGFPDSSVSNESVCNAGDPGLIPGSGRSPGGGIGYPLQYSWASLVAQLLKNLPAMGETWVRSLGWEDPVEKGQATHSSILAWRIPWTVERVAEIWTRLSNFHFTSVSYN